MKFLLHIIPVLVVTLAGCITQFVPETNEVQDLLVVEGLITDQTGPYTVKLSRAMPLGNKAVAVPVTGCQVSVADDTDNHFWFSEFPAGIYKSDAATFQAVPGREYTLHIRTEGVEGTRNYESIPLELVSVPPVDSLYYEKVVIREKNEISGPLEGCEIYLDTHDPTGKCRYYRWDYAETWEFQLPYMVPNRICWFDNNSVTIKVKNTTVLEAPLINRYPILFISNESDRLSIRYSILVSQYSLNEDEYIYWEKLQRVSQEVGGLYDIIPSSIPGNVFCVEDPAEQVLGFFSVSGKTSERLFIRENFKGLANLYKDCPSDTIYGNKVIPNLDISAWVIVDEPYLSPPYKVITNKKTCADCSVRGTTVKPDFWDDDE